MYYRRVATGPTLPSWNRERLGSHSRIAATCGVGHRLSASSFRTVVTPPPVALARSYSLAPRAAGPRVDYLEEHRPPSVRKTLLEASDADCDGIEEKERNPSPALVATGGVPRIALSFARRTAEDPRVACTGADDNDI